MADLTTPSRGPRGRGSESFGDWVQQHAKAIAAGAVVLAAAGGLAFVVQQINRSSDRQAEQQYFAAQAAGTPQQQEQALDRVVGSFDGTTGATQAAMLLAQLRYSRGAYAEGVAALRRVEDSAGDEFEAAIDALIAAGLEGQGKFADAAAKYREAAQAARFEADRDGYLADAARALRAAGNSDEAVRLWTELAEDESSSTSAEARVRLGELTAKAASRG